MQQTGTCSSQQAGLKIDSSAQQNEKRNFARIKMQTQITRYFIAPNGDVSSWNIRLPELRLSNFHPKYGWAEVHLVAWCQNWISSSSLFSCQLRPQPSGGLAKSSEPIPFEYSCQVTSGGKQSHAFPQKTIKMNWIELKTSYFCKISLPYPLKLTK